MTERSLWYRLILGICIGMMAALFLATVFIAIVEAEEVPSLCRTYQNGYTIYRNVVRGSPTEELIRQKFGESQIIVYTDGTTEKIDIEESYYYE